MRPPPPQSSQNPGGGGEATSPVRAPRNPQERRRPGAETLDSGGWAQPGHSTCSLPWFSQTAEKTKLGCGEAETTVSEGRKSDKLSDNTKEPGAGKADVINKVG